MLEVRIGLLWIQQTDAFWRSVFEIFFFKEFFMKLKNTKKRILATIFVAGLISTAAFAHGVKLVNAPNGIVVNDVRNKNNNGIANISNSTGRDVSVRVDFLSGNAELGHGYGSIKDGSSADIEVDARYTSDVTIRIK